MRLWPFGRKKEESAFGSSPGASLAPAAPPVVEHDAAATSSPPTTTEQASALPADVREQLAAAGIHIDPSAQVQISTQTTKLTGAQALQFLGQLGPLLAAARQSGGRIQLHPQVQIVAGGRLQESAEQLKARGVDARATVKDLEDKKVVVGDTHVVKLKLEVERPGAAPYEVTTGAIVPAKVTESFAEGKTFAAKIDPDDPKQVLVLWDGA